MCSWWHQAGRSTRCRQLESWWLFLLFRLSCKAEEAPLASQCTSELKHRQAKVICQPAFWERYVRVQWCVNAAPADLQAWYDPRLERSGRSFCPPCSLWSPRDWAHPLIIWPWLVAGLHVHPAYRNKKNIKWRKTGYHRPQIRPFLTVSSSS